MISQICRPISLLFVINSITNDREAFMPTTLLIPNESAIMLFLANSALILFGQPEGRGT